MPGQSSPETRSHQLADRALPVRRARQVLLERVVEAEPPRVAQPHHGQRHQRLGDRAQAVLHVGVRLLDLTAAGRPGHGAVAHDAGDQ
jgi:hypothetical protein